MNKENITDQLLSLLFDGDQISGMCHYEDDFTEVISGADYVSWITQARTFVNRYVKEEETKAIFNEAALKANGSHPRHYEVMKGILLSLKEYDFQIIQKDTVALSTNKLEKVFISHSSKDIEYVKELVKLLHSIGFKKSANNIFCSSLPEYGIPYGDNIYDYLKQEMKKSNIMVLFVLSDNYYQSAPSLNEMGAAWLGSKDYNSVLTPNFDYKKISGAIDINKIAFHMNDEDGVNKFRDRMVEVFELEEVDYKTWNKDRADYLQTINEIASEETTTQNTEVKLERIKGLDANSVELQVRFKNITDKQIDFKYVEFFGQDSEGNKFELSISDTYLQQFKLHSHENRVETITVESPKSWVDFRKVREDKVSPNFETYPS